MADWARSITRTHKHARSTVILLSGDVLHIRLYCWNWPFTNVQGGVLVTLRDDKRT